MSARPWMKFFPADWRSDPALRMCSLASRGLWMEMLCVMHEASPRGYLVVNGKPMQERQIASLAGCAIDETRQYLDELRDAGVFSHDEHGTIYSRRMVREPESPRPPARSGLPPSLRQMVFERDGNRCFYCGATDGPFEIDHMLPWSRGGAHIPENLAVACRPCNRSKGARSIEEWMQ